VENRSKKREFLDMSTPWKDTKTQQQTGSNGQKWLPASELNTM
jgi:hypothetical protein